jgi:EAL domain-containing protein (putative c-di-GMP-specific phosphodiesterase class I)
MALYKAKEEGRGSWCFFEPEMDITAQKRRGLERDLRNAVERGLFEIYFQPLVEVKTGRYSTAEALLRWHHPERGWISPAEFIPIAEETGLIVEIGTWVLQKACMEATAWPSDIRVAVNLSPIQFRHGGLVRAVIDALRLSGLAPSRLELEITESVLLDDVAATRRSLEELQRLGIRISLDDFGTGFSSLSYLHKFPLQKVKLDRSFVTELRQGHRSLILLRGVARLSRELGIAVAVEGVETEEQLALVCRGDDVDEIQGFLFSKPIPANELRALISRGNAMAAKVA